MLWFLFFLLPVILLWIYALMGVIRRDMQGWKKAVWVLAILAFPILGSATYIIWSSMNPEDELEKLSPADRARAQYGTQFVTTLTNEMDVLGRLRDQGEINDDEYRELVGRVEGGPQGSLGVGSHSVAYLPSAGLEIRHFVELRNAGEISDAEFKSQKLRVVSTPPRMSDDYAA